MTLSDDKQHVWMYFVVSVVEYAYESNQILGEIWHCVMCSVIETDIQFCNKLPRSTEIPT